MGEIRCCLCKNDPDNDWADDCFATFNDMMRLDESDTDSDMPYLVGPSEIQSVLDEHHEDTETPQYGNGENSAMSDTDTTTWVNPTVIQEMIGRYNMLVDEGRLPSYIEPSLQENMVNHGPRGKREKKASDGAAVATAWNGTAQGAERATIQ